MGRTAASTRSRTETRRLPLAALERVARAANVLLAENRLAGRFVARGPGLVELELAHDDRTFFHNGIVFAALDAVNDPVRNPTLTMMAAEGEPET